MKFASQICLGALDREVEAARRSPPPRRAPSSAGHTRPLVHVQVGGEPSAVFSTEGIGSRRQPPPLYLPPRSPLSPPLTAPAPQPPPPGPVGTRPPTTLLHAFARSPDAFTCVARCMKVATRLPRRRERGPRRDRLYPPGFYYLLWENFVMKCVTNAASCMAQRGTELWHVAPQLELVVRDGQTNKRSRTTIATNSLSQTLLMPRIGGHACMQPTSLNILRMTGHHSSRTGALWPIGAADDGSNGSAGAGPLGRTGQAGRSGWVGGLCGSVAAAAARCRRCCRSGGARRRCPPVGRHPAGGDTRACDWA